MGDPRGPYITPFRSEMTAMFEHPDLTHLDKALAGWLVFAVDPGTRRIEGVTVESLAELHRTGRRQVRESLARLRDAGMVAYEFQRRTTGWVELCGYDQIVHWTPWLSRQRQRAHAKAQANRTREVRQPADDGPVGSDSPAETPRPFLTLIMGATA